MKGERNKAVKIRLEILKEKTSRMVPGGPLGVPWRVPGEPLGRPWGLRGAVRGLFGEITENVNKMKCAGSSKVSVLGPGRDPKIDPKTILAPKRKARKRNFIDFSRGYRFSNFWARFSIDF